MQKNTEYMGFVCIIIGLMKSYEQSEIEDAVEKPAIIHYLRYVGESHCNADNVHSGTVYLDKYLTISSWADYTKKEQIEERSLKLRNFYIGYSPRVYL